MLYNISIFCCAFNFSFNRNVLVTPTHLYILREATNKKGFSYIMARRSLADVVRITSKKRCSEFITFRYGRVNSNGETIVYGVDRIYIPDASEATKMIKQLIVKCIDEKEESSKDLAKDPPKVDNSKNAEPVQEESKVETKTDVTGDSETKNEKVDVVTEDSNEASSTKGETEEIKLEDGTIDQRTDEAQVES